MRLIDAECFSERFDMMCDAGGVLAPVTKAVREMVKKLIKAEPTVDAKPERYKGQWISTKEKMPEKDTSVLICACGHRVTAYYNHLKKAFVLTENEKLYYEKAAVSHWMPLPEVPNEDAININVPDRWIEADFEPVRHGRWIECDYKKLEHGFLETYPKAGLCCSVCRAGFEKKKMTYKQHCPCCGAKMDGGDE